MLSTCQASTPQLGDMQFIAFSKIAPKSLLLMKSRNEEFLFDEVANDVACFLGLTTISI